MCKPRASWRALGGLVAAFLWLSLIGCGARWLRPGAQKSRDYNPPGPDEPRATLAFRGERLADDTYLSLDTALVTETLRIDGAVVAARDGTSWFTRNAMVVTVPIRPGEQLSFLGVRRHYDVHRDRETIWRVFASMPSLEIEAGYSYFVTVSYKDGFNGARSSTVTCLEARPGVTSESGRTPCRLGATTGAAPR